MCPCTIFAGTGKWNKIECHMFCWVTETGTGTGSRPRGSKVELSGDTTKQRMSIKVELDQPTHVKVIAVMNRLFVESPKKQDVPAQERPRIQASAAANP